MKKHFFKVALAFVVLSFVGCDAQEPPVQVELFERYNQIIGLKQNFLRITAIADSVEILDIIPNRGKCQVGGLLDSSVKIYKKLGFGETWNNIPLANCSRLSEVKIITDKGEFNFTFNGKDKR